MKQYKILFSPHALHDIEQASHYYNEQQTGLGSRFATEVLKTIETIRKNPEFTRIRYDEIRCAVINKFPFLIHYSFDAMSKTITVLAVYSTYKEPLW